jgi:hypothetical protein
MTKHEASSAATNNPITATEIPKCKITHERIRN